MRMKGCLHLTVPGMAAAVLVAGCTAAQKQEWYEFWGVQPTQSKPAVKGRAAAPSSDAAPRPAAGRSDASQGVDREVGDYVRRMTAPPSSGFQPNDHTAKIRRQRDPTRRQRIRDAAVRRDPNDRADGEAADSKWVGRTDAETDRSRAGMEPRSPVRTASTDVTAVNSEDQSSALGGSEELPPPEEFGLNQPTVFPRQPEGAVRGAGPDNKAGGAESSSTSSGAGGDGGPLPELAEVKITAAPEPVRPAESDPSRSASGATPNAAARTTEPVDTFARRLQELETLVEKNPNNMEAQLRIKMMYLINGQEDKALASVPGVDADLQEIMLSQIRALNAARSGSGRDPALWANQQLESIEDLRRRVRARADLMIPKVALCTAIDGFGRYEPIEPAEFPAGLNNRVLVYIEVDNFQSDKTPSGLYRTLLSVRQYLLDKSGQELWSKRDENIEDLARQQRRDFYLTIGPIAIPKSLALGEYVLKVEVEDVVAGKINSNVARFKIVP